MTVGVSFNFLAETWEEKWSEQTFQSDERYLTDIFCPDQTIFSLVLMSELLNAGWQSGQKYEEFRVADFALCIL